MTGARMQQITIPAAVLSLTLGAAIPQPATAQEEHRLQADKVAVYNVAGEVEIVPGTEDDVIVQITRGGAHAGQLDTEIRDVEGREALVVVYPDDNIVYPGMGEGSKTDTSNWDAGHPVLHDVHVHGAGKGLEAWADLKILVPAGKDLAMHLAVGGTTVRDIDGSVHVSTLSGRVRAEGGSGQLTADTGSGSVDVTGFNGDVLADTGSGAVTITDSGRETVIADTGNGSVTLSNVQATEVSVDTGNGAVELSDVRGDTIGVDTGNGKVSGNGITATSLVVDTGSGRIDIKGVTCPEVNLDTGNGAVDIELLGDVDELVVDTGSGGVTLRLPDSVGAQIEVDAESGGIDVEIPMEIRKVEKDYLVGVLGDGEGTIEVDTGTGGVRVIGG